MRHGSIRHAFSLLSSNKSVPTKSVLTNQSSLVRQFHQSQNVDPKQRHKMPIPRGDIDYDVARFKAAAQNDRRSGNQQGENAAEKMDRVRAGQQIHERTARAGRDEEAARRQISPCQELAGEETKTEDDGQPQPGEF